MAHKSQKEFCISIKNKFPEKFINCDVLDCGSFDVNGNNRYLYEKCSYTGIDIIQGKNVDIVTKIHEFIPEKNKKYMNIISTECLEHDMFYRDSLKNMYNLLSDGGIMIFTCASGNREEHGTLRKFPGTSPGTTSIPVWSNYYKNLEEKDIREVLDVDLLFEEYEFKKGNNNNDLYFYGIKKIDFNKRYKENSIYIVQDYIGNFVYCKRNIVNKLSLLNMPILVHSGAEYGLKNIEYYEKNKIYSYAQNNLKLKNLFLKLKDISFSYFCVIEHDCYISNLKKLELEFKKFIKKCENFDQPCISGNITNSGTTGRGNLVGGFYFVNKNFVEKYCEYLKKFNNNEINKVKYSDIFLHNFILESNAWLFPLNGKAEIAGCLRRINFNLFDEKKFIFHKIDDFYNKFLSFYENKKFPKNKLKENTKYLNDMLYESLSEYKSCGKDGYMYNEKNTYKIIENDSINIEKSIGFHATSFIFFEIEIETPYVFECDFHVRKDANSVWFNIYFDKLNFQINELINSNEFKKVKVIFNQGRHKIILHSIPYDYSNQLAHSCLINPKFIKSNNHVLSQYYSSNDYYNEIKNIGGRVIE